MTTQKDPQNDNAKKAAMALNLCTTSISKIIESQDINTMRREYDYILNNINLENINKHEALLSTLKAILDTISFYLIQSGDKAVLQRRYRHKMNNAIWDSVSGIPQCIIGVFSSPWAALYSAAATAVMSIGCAYMSYRKSKANIELERFEQEWKLERSALEQLHALKLSLFETAWRLFDSYNIRDEYFLSVNQVNLYNALLMEPNPKWRFQKLKMIEQYFEAYPYFWYELSETAYQCYYDEKNNLLNSLRQNEKLEYRKTDVMNYYLKHAQIYITKFFEIIAGKELLRHDIIYASAILRGIQIEQELAFPEKTSWNKAIENVSSQISNDKEKKLDKLAALFMKFTADSPELLMNAAMMYMAAAFENCREDADEPNGTCANHAKDILWMLVNRGYNMPITSRLLSGIYLRQKNKKEYALLKELVGENNVVSEPEKLFDMELRKKDSVADIMHIAGTMFDAALMDACPIFNNENNAILALRNYFNENNLYKKNDVKKEVQRWQQAVYLCLNKQILDWVAIWNIDQGIMLDSISRLKERINKFIEEMKQTLSSPMLQAETVGKMIERCRARFIVILKSAAVPGKLNEDDFSDLDNKLFQLRIRTAQYIGKKLIFNVSNVKTPMGGIIDYFNKMICYSSSAPEDAWDKGLDTALKNKSTFIINGDKFKEILEGEKIKELVKKVKEKAMEDLDDNEKIIVYTQDDRLNPSEIQDLRNRLGDYVKYFFARMFNSQIRDFRQKYDKAQWRIGIFPSKIIISYNYDHFGE